MTDSKKVGEIEKYERKIQIDWKIADFSPTFNDFVSFESPAFTVGDTPCYFRLYPKSQLHREFMAMFLMCKTLRKFTVDCRIGLRKKDGSVDNLVKGILTGDRFACGPFNIIEMSELSRRASELAPNDVITFTCSLNLEVTDSTQPIVSEITNPLVSEITKPLSLSNLDKLSQNFKDLFNNKETCDTTLKVEDKDYSAHKTVLIARSPVFAAMFQHNMKEKQTGVITIPDCDTESFREFLEYLYCGQLEQLSFRSAFHLYNTSNKYDVPELKQFCVEYLKQCLAIETVCAIVSLSDKYDETELFSVAQDFFIENVSKILVTSEWENLLKKDYRLANKLMVEMSKVKLRD